LLLGGKLNAILRREHERELQSSAPTPQPAWDFFCDVRIGESFLFVFADCMRSQRSARLRAGFVWGKSSKRRKSFTEPGQITNAEAQGVAEEKETAAQKSTNVVKEKKEGEGVAKSIAEKEDERVAHSVSDKIAVGNPCSAVRGGARARDPNAFSHATRYRSANDCERHHSTGRSWEVRFCWRSGLRTAAEPNPAPRLVVLVAAGSHLSLSFAVGA
jgi:hypothetical protein